MLGQTEVQTVKTSGNEELSGAFTLTSDGQTTAPLPFDASPFFVEQALGRLYAVPNVDVTRTTHADHGFTWTLTFDRAVGNFPVILANANGLIGSGAAVDVAELRMGTVPAHYGSAEGTLIISFYILLSLFSALYSALYSAL